MIEWLIEANTYCIIQGELKKRGTLLLSISSLVVDRFSKLFTGTLRTICNNVFITSHHTVNVSLHYLVKYQRNMHW